MKKVIESELVSIAYRILKLKDKSDVNALFIETQKLYEKISVLKFYEDNKFRLDASLTEEKLIDVFEASHASTSENKTIIPEGIEDLETSREQDILNEVGIETVVEQLIETPPDYMSAEIVKELLDDTASKDDFIDEDTFISTPEGQSISFHNKEVIIQNDSIKEENFQISDSNITSAEEREPILEIDPVFHVSFDQIQFEEKGNETIVPNSSTEESSISVSKKLEVKISNKSIENQHLIISKDTEKTDVPFHKIPLNKTINDAFSKTISIGLNDRIAFEKNLFNNSSEDLNRVISQLNTIENFQEAEDFIEDLVKPDFQYWQGKEEYEKRFMDLVQKRFL